MSRGKRSASARAAGPADAQQEAQIPPVRGGVAAFLRELAQRAEGDPTFASSLGEAMRASGLLPAGDTPAAGIAKSVRGVRAQRSRSDGHAQHAPTKLEEGGRSKATTEEMPLDPYAVLRVGGVEGLRAALAQRDLAGLRAIVRSRRFDPARISARWTAKERLIELIVTQTQARADHGKAFARL